MSLAILVDVALLLAGYLVVFKKLVIFGNVTTTNLQQYLPCPILLGREDHLLQFDVVNFQVPYC